MTDTVELLPCPFCDGEVFPAFENLWDDEDGEVERCWTVQHTCPVLQTDVWSNADTESGANTAWNNRPATVPKSVADGLAEALDVLIPVHDNPVHMTAMERVNAWAAASAFARNRLAEYRKATQ